VTSSLPMDLSSDDPSKLKPAQRPTEISLSHEQKHILELVVQQKSVFYTGSAGVLSLSSVPRAPTYCLPMLSSAALCYNSK
jgi:hypothetical protein